MDADEIIARTCGTLLSRGVSAAEVLKAERLLRGLAKRSGGPMEIDLHGLRITLPRDSRPPVARRRRETRA